MTTAIFSHTDCNLHDNGSPHHPESPLRIDAIRDQLISSGLSSLVRYYDAEPATRKTLTLAHKTDYIDLVFRLAPTGSDRIMLDGDTGMNQHSLRAALLAAGAATMAVDKVLQGEHDSAFCAIRPPGHHAKAGHSAGFCIFNNIALAAFHALQNYGLKRVAIVDFDVHHGDGTEAIVRNHPGILFCSSFQHPYYPYSGAEPSGENILNMPLAAGTSGEVWRPKVMAEWLPALREFRPELILISAGFDSHREDDMGGLNLLESDYIWITQELCAIAAEHAQGRIVSCLEGGYDLPSLARSAAAHVKALVEYV